MTLFDVEELTRYWIDHPPLHLMIAAYLGIGKERHQRATVASRRDSSSSASNSDVEHLIAELGPELIGGDVHAGMSPAILDFTELRRKNKSAPN